MRRSSAVRSGSAVKCAHSASCRASFGFIMCSVLFDALHFFCRSFFGGKEMPQGACA